MVSDYLSNTLQRYKINSILPNISALFFKFFLKYFPANNNPSLLRNNMLLSMNKGTKRSDPFVPFYVELAEIFTAQRQLMMHQRGQHFFQLQEEALAGLIAIGKHVITN